MRPFIISCVLLAIVSGLNAFANPHYSSTEHVLVGDKVLFRLMLDREPPNFTLPNGLTLSYGQLVALGDFYGTPNAPISQGLSEADRRARFLVAFNAFASDKATVPETIKLLNVIAYEQRALEDGMQRGETPAAIYQRISNETGRQYNCVTGGGCSTKTWWLKPGRYLKLVKNDFDHFGEHAILVYQTGYQLAVELALQGYQLKDKKKLNLAYATLGFASHFLADRFAAGHMRTPRLELNQSVTPSVVGALLSHYMHNEENELGLHVHDQLNRQWIALGDYYFLDSKNNINRLILEKVLQSSVDQITSTYLTGQIAKDRVLIAIPYADESQALNPLDPAPMFYYDHTHQTLMRRKNLKNSYERQWTKDWWGWSTLTLLIKQHGELPAYQQAALAFSDEKKEAFTRGLITNPELIQALNGGFY